MGCSEAANRDRELGGVRMSVEGLLGAAVQLYGGHDTEDTRDGERSSSEVGARRRVAGFGDVAR